jgi:ADP-ribosyl-[dinitrogen reductase] hydrolase
LGVTTEAQLPARRRDEHGEIRDYIPNRYCDDPIGFPSDDTQMAFWTLEQMLKDGRYIPENVADCFCHRRIFGIGKTVREFIANRKSGLPWYECGPNSAGNGALMRIAPILIPHLRQPTCDLWVDTALAAMTTHNDAGSTAACIAFVYMLWQLLGMATAPEPEWWPTTYVRVARELEGETRYRPRNAQPLDYDGPIWRLIEKSLTDAYRRGLTVLDACSQWYSGAYLPETVPSVIYILMRHGHDLEEAIVLFIVLAGERPRSHFPRCPG